MSLVKKLKKNSRLTHAAVITESKIADKAHQMVPTNYPILNLALSGRFKGGITPGVTTIAGPSRHFKSKLLMILGNAYMDHYEDSAGLFYDSEFGTPKSYIDEFGEKQSRLLHSPILNFEELKFDLVHQLENIDDKDRVCVLIDSLGNLASKKEIDDAKDQKSVADFTRAKANKSLFRMVTGQLAMKGIPLIAIQHVYQEMSLYPKDIIAGGTGTLLASDTAIILGRRQNKNQKTKEIEGYDFIMNIEKSRFVKEGLKLPLNVTWNEGVKKWSGLFDLAMAFKFIYSESQGWYQTDMLEGKHRRADLENNDEFWTNMLADQAFVDTIENHLQGKTSDKQEAEIEEALIEGDE